ncbi:hypothetical protein IG631_04803 [Alternaria alternata]|nr:hypothetical protein IG631_04803 [Alternaria alternata]
MSLPVLCVLAYFVFLVARVFYRLYFHPLSRFPGPRIAAVSSWYEAYYEIVLKGQYSRQISKLHDEYGPIVRVTPDELHIRDPSFYEQVYAKNLHLDKEGWDKRFGCAGGLLPTVNAEQHKRRRAAVAHMYDLCTATTRRYTISHGTSDEAQIIIGGGVETTAFSLSTAAFHIINTPRIYERLHRELVEAFPSRDVLELGPLEKMPYFKAIIMETARMSYGLSARNPRTHKTPLKYGQWVVPANTCIHVTKSMTIPDVSHDETIFPSSHEFIPERWLDDPKTPEGIPLERFMVSFGRGTRSCLGINLAYIELYLTLGMMFRRYKFELHESDVEDVTLAHDFFIPVAKLDSKGLRVLIKRTGD